MKKHITITAALLCATLLYAQDLSPIQLKTPDMTRSATLMDALLLRASVREYSDRMLTDQDLSDLLWAANGINRPDRGGRTAPSAVNAQDIDIYVLTAQGIYFYNAHRNLLEPIAAGDFRAQIYPQQAFVATAPVNLMLVSDLSRFTRGDDATKARWADM
ncbi:MAG: nitroreductase family protein, partial [Chitinispirillales bacterium]|nr:nitroreductase family protein [Chitinispirillales bacterium]